MNVTPCQAIPCVTIYNSCCVFYEGENLLYTGIVTNDTVQTALQKIDAAIGQGGGGGSTYTNGNPSLAVGGIPAGSTFTAQTMTQMWDQLLYGYTSGVFSIKLTTAPGILNTGSAIDVYNSSNVLVKTYTITGAQIDDVLPVGVYHAVIRPLYGLSISLLTLTYGTVVSTYTGNTIPVINISGTVAAVVGISLAQIIAPEFNAMVINDGDASTAETTVYITTNLLYADYYMLSENSNFAGAVWVPYTATTLTYFKDFISSMTLTLYLKFKNTQGESATRSDSIELVNAFRRSDSPNEYNKLQDAIDAVMVDYSGNLTTNVRIYCIATATNKRNVAVNEPYTVVINGLNVNSPYALTLDGANLFTMDAYSLGGIRIKHSNNILIENMSFINVGSQIHSANPDELSAIYCQGTQALPCNNVVVKHCTINCKETVGTVVEYGNYGIIAKSTLNFTVTDCTILNPAATIIKCSFVDNLNVVKNAMKGFQIYGLIGQPCHVSCSNGYRVSITDNNCNGESFDTGFILDAVYIDIHRNQFYNYYGEVLRISNSRIGEVMSITSNSFFNNLLLPPAGFTWVRYQMIINNNWNTFKFLSNTCQMHGISTLNNYNAMYEYLIKGFNCVITNFVFSNNIIDLDYIISYYPNNTAGGEILSFPVGGVLAFESNNNIYIDIPNAGVTLNTWIINTGFPNNQYLDSVAKMNLVGYDVNSQQVAKSASIFVNRTGFDYHLTANGNTVTTRVSGQYDPIDQSYSTAGATVNSGAYGYAYTPISEVDVNTDYTGTDLLTGTVYTTAQQIVVFSTEVILFQTINTKRDVVMLWKVFNAANPSIYSILLGNSGFITFYSNLNPDGTFLSDATYNIEINIL